MTRLLALVWPELRLTDADAAPWERMLDALDDLSPRVEAVDLGVALVDVTGLEPMYGPERKVAARAAMLTRAVAPLDVRCGIGDNRWLATLAARLARPAREGAPAAFRTLDRDELRDLPLGLLPADPATRQRLALFGLTTMSQLAELPRSAVGAQFGAVGERLQALARGHDPRPLVPRRRPERVEASATFETPVEGVGSAGLTLRRLAAELCDRLRDRHRAPGRAVLTLRLEDAPVLRVAQPFPQPALEPDWIARLLLSRVESAARARARRYRGGQPTENEARNSPSRWSPMTAAGNSGSQTGRSMAVGYRAEQIVELEPEPEPEPRVSSVHLAFDRLADPAIRQLPAFEARAGRWEELRWSLERIRHRFGEGRLWRAVTDRPTAALPEHRSRLVDIGQ
jgi:nucleotidyltransferase/DNA polymerase involved in DNA repair